jgi:hypothetical protein
MYKLRQLTHKLNKVLWFFFRKRYVCINSGSSLTNFTWSPSDFIQFVHHNLSLSRLVVILLHTTGSTWYKVLYQNTMYVMGIYFLFALLKKNSTLCKHVPCNTLTHSTNEGLLNIKRKGDPEVSYPLSYVRYNWNLEPVCNNRLDLIQSLVPKHYVCYGYLFLICAFKYLEVMEICETKLLL